MLYGPTAFFTKLSLFLLYLSLFRPKPTTRILIYIGITAISMMYSVTTITEAVLCIPLPGHSWISTVYTRKCINTKTIGYVAGSFNVVSDLYLLVLPLPIVWSLQLPLRKKIGLSAIFMSGFLSVTPLTD